MTLLAEEWGIARKGIGTEECIILFFARPTEVEKGGEKRTRYCK